MTDTKSEIKLAQDLMNKFTSKYLKGVQPIAEDGIKGEQTDRRIKSVKFYLGYGKTVEANSTDITEKFMRALRSPKARSLGARVLAAGAGRRARQRRSDSKRGAASNLWGGSRTVTNEVIGIVNNRFPITSRKRTATFGNPGSDHHVSQLNADAVDFGTDSNHALKNEISRKLGGPSELADSQNFHINRRGKRFRVQMIARTHGTGPHLHVGVRRA